MSGSSAKSVPGGGEETSNSSAKSTPDPVWTEAEIKQDIRRREHQLTIARKQQAKNTELAQQKLEEAIDNYYKPDLVAAQKSCVSCEAEIIKTLNPMPGYRKLFYFISVWGLFPIFYATGGLVLAFLAIWRFSNVTIMGVVPFWAPLIAVIGGSVQILAGVVQDYREDCLITQYKSLWYLIILPVSFALGFIAIYLINAGLISITQGQFGINTGLNQTVTTLSVNQTIAGATNQTATSLASVTQPTGSALALPLILCFLAGYATQWFMDLLNGFESLIKPNKSSSSD